MLYFCTFFDHRYLSRGLALHRSLDEHSGAFQMWILCMDDETLAYLSTQELRGAHLVSLGELEKQDEGLREAKGNRSLIEYYFTCKASLCLHVLNVCDAATHVTYLDADLFYFASPEILYKEMGDAAVSITPHRFTSDHAHLAMYGKYNAGWVTFRRDEEGLACLRWWRERCIEWCEDMVEADRYADQKYIDQFPQLFGRVHIMDHPGANLAPWNIENYEVTWDGKRVLVEGRPLIFFHFHGLRRVSGRLFDSGLAAYNVKLNSTIRKYVYCPYLAALAQLSRSGVLPNVPVLSRKIHGGSILNRLPRRFIEQLGKIKRIGKGLYSRAYIVGPNRKPCLSPEE